MRINVWKDSHADPAKPWAVAGVDERIVLKQTEGIRRLIAPEVPVRYFATQPEALKVATDFVDLWYPR